MMCALDLKIAQMAAALASCVFLTFKAAIRSLMSNGEFE
jgi:hypothetical protein